MASVYLLSAASQDPARRPEKALLDLEQMRMSAEVDRFHEHEVVDDPAAADLILFVETVGGGGAYFHRIRRHPIYREFRSKSYLFAAEDEVIALLPGVYVSIERRWYRPTWTRSGFYPGVQEHADLHYDPDHTPSLLYSFLGNTRTHRVRERIMELQRPDSILLDSHAESVAIERGERPPVPPDEFRRRYARIIKDSAFVLCPRGAGTSTFRLFEAMMLGRVPVIVSNHWVPPDGPEWERFSLRVSEEETKSIPATLEARAADAEAMGAAARNTWVEWFSQESFFHRTVDWCLDLARLAPTRGGVRRYLPYLQFMRPYHAVRATAKRIGY